MPDTPVNGGDTTFGGGAGQIAVVAHGGGESHGEAGKSAEHFGVTKTPAPDPAENTEEDQ